MNKKEIYNLRLKLDYSKVSITEKILLSRYGVSRLEDLDKDISYKQVDDLLSTLTNRIIRDRVRYDYRTKIKYLNI